MAKEVIGFNRLDEHVVFSSKNEMNYAVADHLKSNAAFLRDNSKEILTYIAKIASHHNGACGVLYKTIADRLSITKRTVERCMSELKTYNIIEVVKQYSKRGGRMSSVIRILPFVAQKITVSVKMSVILSVMLQYFQRVKILMALRLKLIQKKH